MLFSIDKAAADFSMVGTAEGEYQHQQLENQSLTVYRTKRLDFLLNASGNDKIPILAQLTFGHQKGTNLDSDAELNLKVYEYLVRYQKDQNKLVVGLIPTVFGLPIQDLEDLKTKSILKNAFDSNSFTQSSAAQIDSGFANLKLNGSYLSGHPSEPSEFKQKGFAANLIFHPDTLWSYGIGYLNKKNQFREIQSTALYLKYSQELFWNLDFEIAPYFELAASNEQKDQGTFAQAVYRRHVGDNLFAIANIQYDEIKIVEIKKAKSRIKLGLDYGISNDFKLYTFASAENLKTNTDTNSNTTTYNFNLGFNYLFNTAAGL